MKTIRVLPIWVKTFKIILGHNKRFLNFIRVLPKWIKGGWDF